MKEELEKDKRKRPVIEFEGKKYIFSPYSIIILGVGAPLLAYLIYFFFDLPANYWLHEIVVKQTNFFLKLLFNTRTEVVYDINSLFHWKFIFPVELGLYDIHFETFCTGIQAICVFAGIIICTPHSQDRATSEDIIWRKTKALVVSSLLFYVVNIIRMLIQLNLYYNGADWIDIHYSISAASSLIAAIIILLLHNWIPEFILSIIYTGTLVSEPIKQKRKERIKEDVYNDNKVDLSLIRKSLGMKKRIFVENLPEIVKKADLVIKDGFIIIPKGQESKFLELVEKKFEERVLDKKEKIEF